MSNPAPFRCERSVSLPELQECARHIALSLQPGDVITLQGQVGAGKTTFARALITAIAAAPCEVTSPTFTLMQSYDVMLQGQVPETLWHLDLYRLEEASEIQALGLEELWPHVVIAEWPELIGALLPADTLSLALDFMPAEDVRLLRFSGGGVLGSETGRDAVMQGRAEIIDLFLAQAGWDQARRVPLAGDASFRRYERITQGAKKAVLMDAPPAREDVRPFLRVAELLNLYAMSPPQVIARDETEGLLLLEDLGDDLYSRILRTDPAKEEELYLAACEVLVELYDRAGAMLPPSVMPYDRALLMRECALFADWFLPSVMTADRAAGHAEIYKVIWGALLAKIPELPAVLTLRDFHADNLLWLPERSGIRRVGLLDFQDAVAGSPAYDLVSILEDARRDVSEATVRKVLEHYRYATGIAEDAFAAAYALLGAQRNCKIIGIFCRLASRDGKRGYLAFLPRVWRHLMQDLKHPLLAPLRQWMNEVIRPEWRTAEVALTPRKPA